MSVARHEFGQDEGLQESRNGIPTAGTGFFIRFRWIFFLGHGGSVGWKRYGVNGVQGAPKVSASTCFIKGEQHRGHRELGGPQSGNLGFPSFENFIAISL